MNSEQVWHSPWVETRVLSLTDESGRGIRSQAPTVRLTDADRALIERCGLKESKVLANMPLPSSSDAVRRERETVRLKIAKLAGALDAAETATMNQLKVQATVGTLDPDGQRVLLALLDRHLAGRGGAR